MGPQPLRRRRAFATVALVCALMIIASCGGSSTTQKLSGVVLDPPLAVGSLSLPDATTEERVSFVAPSGGLLAVYFGYTNCPDLCPTTMADLKVAIGDLGSAGERVEVALVTVDPARDTADVLTTYLGHFFTSGAHPLRTTDWNELRAVQAAFLASSTISHDSHGTNVSHTAATSIVDDRGTVLVQWPFGTTPKTMVADLRVLLSRAEKAAI